MAAARIERQVALVGQELHSFDDEPSVRVVDVKGPALKAALSFWWTMQCYFYLIDADAIRTLQAQGCVVRPAFLSGSDAQALLDEFSAASAAEAAAHSAVTGAGVSMADGRQTLRVHRCAPLPCALRCGGRSLRGG